MTCPNCGYEHLRPYSYDHPARHYKCWKCGFQFSTVEQVREVAERQAFQATLLKIMNGKGENNELRQM